MNANQQQDISQCDEVGIGAASRRGFPPFALYAILFISIAACFALLVFRIFVTSRILYNSDAADLSVYAHAVLATHSVFPPGWLYNNGDVWFYNAIIFIVPLIAVFPNGYAVYATATTLYACLILVGLYWGARQMRIPAAAAMLLVAIMASGIASPFLADLLYDWGANYGAEFLVAFIQAIAFAKLTTLNQGREARERSLMAALMGAMVLVGSISNSSRALVYQCAPYALAIPLLWAMRRKDDASIAGSGQVDNATYRTAALVIVAAFVIGSAINHHVLSASGGQNVTTLNLPHIYPLNDLGQHIGMITVSGLFMLGAPVTTWANLLGDVSQVPLLSFAGIWLGVRIVIAIGLVLCAFIFVRKGVSKTDPPAIKAYSAVALAGLALILFLHIFAFRYPPADYESARYYFSPLMIVLIGAFFRYAAGIQRFLNHGVAATAPACGFIVLLAFMNHVYPGLVRSPSGTTEFARTDKEQIVACLRNAGLQHGYGNLWLSQVITILSDYKIIVRPVYVFNSKVLTREPMHALPRWYKGGTWSGPTFLMLDQGDLLTLARSYADMAQPMMDWENRFGRPTKVITCGRDDDPKVKPGAVHVYVYPYNIGPKFN